MESPQWRNRKVAMVQYITKQACAQCELYRTQCCLAALPSPMKRAPFGELYKLHGESPTRTQSGEWKGHNGTKVTCTCLGTIHNKASVHPMWVVQNRRLHHSVSFIDIKRSLWWIAQTAWWVPFPNTKWGTERSQWRYTLTNLLNVRPTCELYRTQCCDSSASIKNSLCWVVPCRSCFVSAVSVPSFFHNRLYQKLKTKLSHLWTGYGYLYINEYIK